MTKVIFDPLILQYQQELTDLVQQIVREKFIAGVPLSRGERPSWAQIELLPPPQIETLDLDAYTGQVDSFLSIHTSDDFGIINLYVIIKDEKGNVIERGNAFDWPDEPNHWAYLATVPVLPGTSVLVYVTAIDGLGGMGALSKWKTI